MPIPTPPSQVELLQASNAVYTPGAVPPGMTRLLDASGNPVTFSVPAAGVYAAAFKDAAGNIIVAYEGTDGSGGTISADTTIQSGQQPAAFAAAATFATNVQNTYASASSPLYVTGHSLGGDEAEYVASELNLGGGSFEATGLPNYAPPAGFVNGTSNFTNWGMVADPVFNYASDGIEQPFLPLSAQTGQPINMYHYGNTVTVGDVRRGCRSDHSGRRSHPTSGC